MCVCVFTSVPSAPRPSGACGLILIVQPITTQESHLMPNIVLLLILISTVSIDRKHNSNQTNYSKYYSSFFSRLRDEVHKNTNMSCATCFACIVHIQYTYNTLFSRIVVNHQRAFQDKAYFFSLRQLKYKTSKMIQL